MNSDEVYRLVEKISETKGTIAKRELLVDDELLKKVLVYAYSPSYKFYMKKLPTTWIGQGTKMFDERTFRLLNVLANRSLSGNKAKSTVRSYIHSLSPYSAELFRHVLRQDLRCGLGVLLINLRYPNLIPVYRVMKAEVYDPSRVTFPVYVCPKIDGYRAQFRDGIFWSRGGQPFVGLDHLVRKLSHFKIAFDGELIIPGVEFNSMGGMLRSSRPCPDACFYVFDAPDIKDGFQMRYYNLEYTVGKMEDEDHVKVVRHLLAHSTKQIRMYYETCRRQGFEGAMVKTMNHHYQKKRSWDWMKLKPEETEDLTCVDYYEGTGRNRGKLGGIVVDRSGQNTRVGSGFSDEQRLHYYTNPSSILGRTVEVLFTEGTKTGKLRHSRFIRVRLDK